MELQWISSRRDITWNTYGRNSAGAGSQTLRSERTSPEGWAAFVGVGRLTLDVALEDFGEDGEECFFEAADGGGVGLAGDADGQAQRLEQVVVEVRLAGVLEKEDNSFL